MRLSPYQIIQLIPSKRKFVAGNGRFSDTHITALEAQMNEVRSLRMEKEPIIL